MAPGVSPLLAPRMDKRFLKVYHKSIMYYSSAVLDHYEALLHKPAPLHW